MHNRTQLESTSEREEGLPAGYADDLMAGDGDIESGTGRRTTETGVATSRFSVGSQNLTAGGLQLACCVSHTKADPLKMRSSREAPVSLMRVSPREVLGSAHLCSSVRRVSS